MRKLSLLLILLGGFTALPALAAEAKIDITSPVDGARLPAKAPVKLVYVVTKEGGGDHVHLYADGEQVALLRQLKGSYTLDPLAQGKHEICIRIVNKNHTPIGVERCIKVAVE